MNPALKRIENRRIGHSGRKSEKRVVHAIGARPTVASGNKAHDKGDAVKGDFRIEAKSTGGVTMRLDLQWLAKINREAIERNQKPMVIVSFVSPDGSSRVGGDWGLVPLAVLTELGVL